MTETTTLQDQARQMGEEHGKGAASWYFDGNTSAETYTAVLRGIEEGDPEILDTFPSAPLSGEWADDPTPSSVLSAVTGRTDWDSVVTDERAIELLDAYEDGFYSASSEEIERVARLQTS